jgi:transposase-like protein
MKLVLSQRASPRLKAQPNISPIVDDPNNNCRSCSSQFSSKQWYRAHLITVHKMKLEPMHNSKPKPKTQLNITPDVHDPDYNCRSCSYQFSSKRCYRAHLKNIHKMKLEPLSKIQGQPDIIPVVDDPNYHCRSCNHQFSSKQGYRNHLMKAHKMKLEPLRPIKSHCR